MYILQVGCHGYVRCQHIMTQYRSILAKLAQYPYSLSLGYPRLLYLASNVLDTTLCMYCTHTHCETHLRAPFHTKRSPSKKEHGLPESIENLLILIDLDLISKNLKLSAKKVFKINFFLCYYKLLCITF